MRPSAVFLFGTVVAGCGLTLVGSTGTDPTNQPSDASSTTDVRAVDDASIVDDGSTTANDADADGSDGNVCSDPALLFDGVDDYATVPDDVALDLNGSFTVEAWVKPAVTTVGTEFHIVSHHDQTFNEGWVLALREGRPELRLYGFNGDSPQVAGEESTATPVLANTWMHVAGTFDGSTLRVYYGGALIDSEGTTFTRRSYIGSAIIGRAAYDPTRFFFQGWIDEVRLSKIARYTGATAPKPTGKFVVDADTVALWRFDELGAATNILNTASAKHAGTLANAPADPKRLATECIEAR